MPRMLVDLRRPTIQFQDNQDPIVNGVANFGAAMAKLPVQLAEIRMRQAAMDEDKRRFEAMHSLNMNQDRRQQAKHDDDLKRNQHRLVQSNSPDDPAFAPRMVDEYGNERLLAPAGPAAPVPGAEGAPGAEADPAADGLPTMKASVDEGYGRVPGIVAGGALGVAGIGAAEGVHRLANAGAGRAGMALTRLGTGTLVEGALSAPDAARDAYDALAGNPLEEEAMVGMSMGALGRDISRAVSHGATPNLEGKVAPQQAVERVGQIAKDPSVALPSMLRRAGGAAAAGLNPDVTNTEQQRNLEISQANAVHGDLRAAIFSLPIPASMRPRLEEELRRAADEQHRNPQSQSLQLFAARLEEMAAMVGVKRAPTYVENAEAFYSGRMNAPAGR